MYVASRHVVFGYMYFSFVLFLTEITRPERSEKRSSFRSLRDRPITLEVIAKDSSTGSAISDVFIEYFLAFGKKGDFTLERFVHPHLIDSKILYCINVIIERMPNTCPLYFSKYVRKTIQLLSASEAPTNIFYIARKSNYEVARAEFTIGSTPLEQTHTIYLDPMFNGTYDELGI